MIYVLAAEPRSIIKQSAEMPEFFEDLTLFKVASDTYVPGFRVGLTDDNNGSARRPLPSVPSGIAPGYDPYSNVLQAGGVSGR